jgi:hypothetical protein
MCEMLYLNSLYFYLDMTVQKKSHNAPVSMANAKWPLRSLCPLPRWLRAWVQHSGVRQCISHSHGGHISPQMYINQTDTIANTHIIFISCLVDFMYCNFSFQMTLAVRTARSAWEHEW